MDTLYIGNRIFVNSEQYPDFFAGGILVSGVDGKVTLILESPKDVDQYLEYNEAEVWRSSERRSSV